MIVLRPLISVVCVVAVLVAGGFWLRFQDARAIDVAEDVQRGMRQFCDEKGRLPSEEEFASLYPALTADRDWRYWLHKDARSARIQYPVMLKRKDAPGVPKTSEFTGMTYAYVMTATCDAAEAPRLPDPIVCPPGADYRLNVELAGGAESCETAVGVRRGPYRSWFNRDLRILMEQGDYLEGRKKGLWVECDRFQSCVRRRYGEDAPADLSDVEIISEPYADLWRGEGSLQGLLRFRLDLDGDDAPELFLGAKALMGKAGGPFSIFKDVPGGYAALGEVFLAPGAFEILPIRHHGFFDLRYCAPMGAEACELLTFAFNGRTYVRLDLPKPDGGYRPLKMNYVRIEVEELGDDAAK